MKNSYFTDENQLEQWVSAAENIRDEFGLEKALGYILGEKFYELASTYKSKQERIMMISRKREKPDYNPKIVISRGKLNVNLDEEYKEAKKEVAVLKEILAEFAELIKDSFTKYEIRQYFSSHMRLGALGHVLNEEEHKVFIEKGVVKHSLETEINDSLVLGDMMKYFDCL
jgi:hypothetical protein